MEAFTIFPVFFNKTKFLHMMVDVNFDLLEFTIQKHHGQDIEPITDYSGELRQKRLEIWAYLQQSWSGKHSSVRTITLQRSINLSVINSWVELMITVKSSTTSDTREHMKKLNAIFENRWLIKGPDTLGDKSLRHVARTSLRNNTPRVIPLILWK